MPVLRPFLLLIAMCVVATATPAFGTSYSPLHVDAAGGELAVVWHRVESSLYVFSLRDGAVVQKLDLGGVPGTILFNDTLGVFWGDVYDPRVQAFSIWQWSPKLGEQGSERFTARSNSSLLQSGSRRFVVYDRPDGGETVFEEMGPNLDRRVVSKWPTADGEATVWFLGQHATSHSGATDVIDVQNGRRLTPVVPEKEDSPYSEWVIARDGAGEWLACNAAGFGCFGSRSPEQEWARREKIPVEGKDARLTGLFADPFDTRAMYAVVVVRADSEMVELWRTRDGAQTWSTSGKRWKIGGMLPRLFFSAEAVWVEVAPAVAEKELRLMRVDRDLCSARELLLRIGAGRMPA